jgi:hypothetical protein
MLGLKRFTINILDEDDFFIRLYADTENPDYASLLNRIFIREEFIILKPWIGVIDINNKKFRIRRSTGILNIGISSVVILGMQEKNKSTIEINMAINWLAIISLVSTTAMLGIITWNYFNDASSWIILSSIIVLQVLFLILDLKNTDKRFLEYIDKIMS